VTPPRRARSSRRRRPRLAPVLAGLLCVTAARADVVASVSPVRISAGTFYDGATLEVRGSVGESSQVAIRVLGASEHHVFNRRGKIGGVIWGGVEHVHFHHAPSVYLLYTSAALPLVARRAVRTRLRLGYDTLETQMAVEGTQVSKTLLIEHFVRLKEREGLYRFAPGAVHLEEDQGGRRDCRVLVPLAAAAPPGRLAVTVFELAGGEVVGTRTATVELDRVGLPASLYRLAHRHGTLFGLLAVLLTLATGVLTDAVGNLRAGRRGGRAGRAGRLLVALGRGLRDVLPVLRAPLKSPEEVARLHAKYRVFRNLLNVNNELLELLAELEEESSWTSFRHPRVRMGIRALFDGIADMVQLLNELSGNHYFDLTNVVAGIRNDVTGFIAQSPERDEARLTLTMDEIASDTAGLVGGKAVNLARVAYELEIRIPEFFVITTEAYRTLLEHEGLAGELRTVLAPARLDEPEDFGRRCELAQGLVDQARIPPAVAEAIRRAARTFGIAPGEGVAVRSSAAGEDSELSFAGQFESILNVPEAELIDAWKRVVRSRFAAGAVFYRRAAGLAEVDTPMAVLVQRMVRPRASGVLFTRRPEQPKAPELLITAARGLGAEVSAGLASADELVVSRPPRRIVSRRLARQEERLEGSAGGGLAVVPVETDEQLRGAISDPEALRLAETALVIERYFGGAQDIEWAIDGEGTPHVLQARPLRTEAPEARRAAPATARELVRGGHPVWAGRAVGPVHVVRTVADEASLPTGAVLVVPQLLPDCVRLLPRVCGIVVERGSVTGHAASIVREFRVPSLFGVEGALEHLADGQMVSLDAASGVVYEGALWPELRGHLPVTLMGNRTVGLPGVLASKLTKLSGSSFMSSWACQSLHDVIRFAHEMSIQEMFGIGDRLVGSAIGGVKRLDCPPPVYLHLLDLGGGLRPEAATQKRVKPEDVVSVPFQGLWRGLGDDGLEARRLDDPGLASFASVMMSTAVGGAERALDAPNYACITDSYLNLNSRQAYHFAIVDAFLSDNQNNNPSSLRLKGGGAAPWQRRLRAEFMAEVLRLRQFRVTIEGDLLNGWCRGIDVTTGGERLMMLGHLLRFSAQLDMWLDDEAQVRRYVEAFVEAEAAAGEKRTGGG
jgi:pyruvate,water dikinase